MTETYMIGIGGTGSRCVESFIHLSAAGLGPDETWLGLVDQDKANGNIDQATQMISSYRKTRKELRQLDTNILSPNCGLFKTKITRPDSGALWCPLPDDGSNLESIFRLDILKPELRDMFECLFSPEEQGLDLGVGFRGKPHIGAAAILSRAGPDEPYWKELLDIIDSARGGKEIRLFLVASVFGGMGASGFPTIARLLRAEIKRRGITSSVKIGGALFLPYFSFNSPSDDQDQEVARSEAFLEQSQGALLFYENLIKKEKIFDSLYMVGWSPIIKLPFHEKGGQNQINPPMIPELYGALAAAHFFSSENDSEQGIYQIGRHNIGEVGWEDLPPIGKDPDEIKAKLGQLVRFAIAYKHVYQPFLTPRPSAINRESWYRSKIILPDVDLKDPKIYSALNNLGEYCDSLLKWVASIEFFGGGQTDINLFSASLFAAADDSLRGGSAELSPVLSKKQRKDFTTLLQGQECSSLHRIFERMTYDNVDVLHKGLGVFCGALFDFCEIDINRADYSGEAKR
jgi:hypothetical protein